MMDTAGTESHSTGLDGLSPTGYNNSEHGLTVESTATLVEKDIDAQENEDLKEEHTPLTDRSVPTYEEELLDLTQTLGIPVSNTYLKSASTCFGIYLKCILGHAWLVLFSFSLLVLGLVAAYHIASQHEPRDGGKLYSFGRLHSGSDALAAQQILDSSNFNIKPCSLSRTFTIYVSTKSLTQIHDRWTAACDMMTILRTRVESNSTVRFCGIQGPMANGVDSNTDNPLLHRYTSNNGQSAYSHVALDEHISMSDEETLYAAMEWHASNLTFANPHLEMHLVRPNSLREVVLGEMAGSLQSASLLMAFMIPTVLMCSLRDAKLVAATTLSIVWVIAIGVLLNELLLRGSDRVCFSKILNVYFCVVTSTLVATFLSSKFSQVQRMIRSRRFHDRWQLSVDPTFLTIFPHFDLAYNSTWTIGACSITTWFAGNFSDNVALKSASETVSLSMLSTLFSLAHIHPCLLKVAEHEVIEYECVENGSDVESDDMHAVAMATTTNTASGEEEEEENNAEQRQQDSGEIPNNNDDDGNPDDANHNSESSGMLPLAMEVGGTRGENGATQSSKAATLVIHRRLKFLLFVCSLAVCIGFAITTPEASCSIAIRQYILSNPNQKSRPSSKVYHVYERFLSEFGPGALYPVQVVSSASSGANQTIRTPKRWKALREVAQKVASTPPLSIEARGNNPAWLSSKSVPLPLKPEESTTIPGLPRNQSEQVAHQLWEKGLSIDGSIAITDISLASYGDTEANSDPIGIAASMWYTRYIHRVRTEDDGGAELKHHMRGIPIEAYEMVHHMYNTLFDTKMIIAIPLLLVHMVLYKSLCLAVVFYVAYFMCSALSRAAAHAVLQRGAMSWIPLVTFSIGAGAGEQAVQWCIPLFAEVSVLLVITLYVNTHVLNRCKQIIHHGHHASTIPIIRAMARLTLKLVCIMAVSLVAARQPVMNQLLLNYMFVMVLAFLTVYCGIMPFLDCLSPRALAWPYSVENFR